MRTIVIIGNGFDIDLGLKTSFKDFIGSPHFTKQSFTPLMNKIRNNYKYDDRWCDIEQIFRDMLSNTISTHHKNYLMTSITLGRCLTKHGECICQRLQNLTKSKLKKTHVPIKC